MADASDRSGVRVIAFLGAALVAAIVVVSWFLLRADSAPPPKPPPAPTRVEPPPTPRPVKAKHVEIPVIAPPQAPQIEPPTQDAAREEKIHLDVEVFGADGLDAPGATVLVLDPFAQHVAGGGRSETARGKTDATGHARFDVGRRTARVFAWRGGEAGASDKFRPTPERAHVVVRMSSAVAVKGRVVESGGAPVAGAAVRFVATPWYDDAFGLVVEATSDKEGAFELPAIPTSAFDSMRDGKATVEARADGWPMASVTVTPDSLRAGDVVVTLERGAFVRGRFVGPTGDPVAGEDVATVDGRSTAVSGTDGKFELPLTRQGGTVIARRHPSELSVISVHHEGFGAAKLLGRFRGDGADVDLGDVVLAEGRSVTGVVVDLDEKPIAAADVTLSLAGVGVAAVQTDDVGKFEIDAVGDDDHSLTATEPPGPNAWSGRRHASVDGVRGGASDLRVRITGALTALVKFMADADGSPVVVPEARVHAEASGATPLSYGWAWAGGGITSVRIEVEHPGAYTATVEIPGYEPATTEAFDMSADRGIEIDVRFRKKP